MAEKDTRVSQECANYESTDTNLHCEDDYEDHVVRNEDQYKEKEGVHIEYVSQVSDWDLSGQAMPRTHQYEHDQSSKHVFVLKRLHNFVHWLIITL